MPIITSQRPVSRRLKSQRISPQQRQRRFQPFLESLEDRRLMAVSIFQEGFDAGLGGGVYAGTQDVLISQGSPTTNFNSAATDLGTRLAVAADALQTLIRFDNIFGSGPGQIPLGAVIVSATLTVDTNTSGDGGHFHRMIADWDEATATWDSLVDGIQTDGVEAETSYRAQIGTSARNGDPAAVSTVIGVTSDLKAWSAGAANRGWGMIAWSGGSSLWQFSNSEVATIADRPRLTVEWLPAGTLSATFRQGVNGYTGAQDTGLTQASPNANNATGVSLNTDFNDAGSTNNTHVLLQFQDFIGTAPDQVPPSSNVLAATISTAATPSNGTGDGGKFHRMLVPWTDTATWNSMVAGIQADDAEASTVITAAAGNPSRTPNAEGGYSEHLVTPDVQAWVDGTAPNHGWASLPWTSGSDGWVIASSENTNVGDRPALTVYFNPPVVEGVTNELDVVGGVLTYKGGLALANALNVSVAAGTYTFGDVTPITVSAAAQALGWLGTGTNSVTGPSSTVNSISVRTGTGDDTVTVVSVEDSITLDGGGDAADALSFGANITTAGTIDVIDFANVTQAAGTLLDLGSGALSVSATNGIGTSSQPLNVRTGSLVANAGAGGMFITEADGTNATVNATGAGEIVLHSTTGNLNMQSNSSSEAGNLTLSSGDDVTITGIIGDLQQMGSVTINANTDGVGSHAYTQLNSGGVGSLTNVTINVNTAVGGTGNALLGAALMGGVFTVNSHAGSILWNGPVAAYPANGTVVMRALNYFFTTTGATSSVGTLAAPLQTDVLSNAGSATISTGSGGVFITDNGADGDLAYASITATGAGDIDLKASSVGGHDVVLRGNVTTGSGNIRVIADDALIIGDGAVIGGVGFSGTVSMMVNRDEGNEQRLTMPSTSSIVTSNATADAVFIEARPATNNSGSSIGGLTVSNITVGNGGTITLNAATGGGAAPAGNIVAAAATTLLDAGVNGNVVLITKDNPIGTAALPIRVTAANVSVVTNSVAGLGSNSGQQAANVFVTSTGPANFSATTTTATDGTITREGSITLASETGVLTVSGLVAADSGTVTITGAGGVVVSGPLGDANTTGNITVTATTGNVSVTSNQTVFGAYTLSLESAATIPLGPQTEVMTGGTLTANQPLELGAGDTLLGSGTVATPVVALSGGSVSPGNASTAILNTNDLTLNSGSSVVVALANTTAGTGYDQVNVVGTVNLGGSTLQLTQTLATPTVGQQFTIINNDSNDAIVGTFASGAQIVVGNLTFGINYAGGDGNDVVLTLTDIVAGPSTFVITSATIESSGVNLVFSADLDPATLNLYNLAGNPFGPTDVTLVGATVGNVRGSLVVAPNRRSARFLPTGGPLAADTYTLTVRSGADGFKDTAGNQLDGDANGTAGDNLVSTLPLTAPPANAVTVSIPEFARGPGQAVNVPAPATGIPLHLSEGLGVTTVSLTLNYDPTLLNITAAALGVDAPVGSTVSTAGSTPGQLLVSFTSPTALDAGIKNFVSITATVPDVAPYLNKHVLDLTSIQINAGAIPAVADDGLHINAYFGDSTGNGSYSATDASRVARVGIGLDTGFDLFRTLDPIIIGDVSLAGGISSTDASRVLRASVGLLDPQIPAIPVPGLMLAPGGPDPKLSLSKDLAANPGDALSIPMLLDSIEDLTATPIESVSVVIEFDPTVIQVDTVTLGDLASGPGWSIVSNIDNVNGRVMIAVGALQPLGGLFSGTIFNLNVTVLEAAASGATPLNLMQYGPGGPTQINEGYLTLIPAPSNFASDLIDGVLTIGGGGGGGGGGGEGEGGGGGSVGEPIPLPVLQRPARGLAARRPATVLPLEAYDLGLLSLLSGSELTRESAFNWELAAAAEDQDAANDEALQLLLAE